MTQILNGDRFFEPDFKIFLNRETEAFATPMHSHDFVELCLVLEGKGYQYIDECLLEVQKGDLFLLPVGTSHVFRPNSPDKASPLIILNCIFDLSVASRLQDWIPEQSELIRYLYAPARLEQRWFRHADKRGQFLSLFNQAYLEYSERPAGFQSMVTAILLQMLQLVHRVQLERNQEAVPHEAPRENIDDALYFIENHYSDRITLKSLADRSFMSVGHFQNQFKKATGQTFNHYIQHVRIQKCCQLLRTTDKSVQQSANEVGYSDMKFFHSLFRKITGSSPLQYRKV
ncbi:AraC family transcriptional regulator [Cohnella cholangitidis]|nr:AraC family transcriptional regulator [Cohnella cholangitidis]